MAIALLALGAFGIAAVSSSRTTHAGAISPPDMVDRNAPYDFPIVQSDTF